MSWNYEASRERIKNHLAGLGKIEIEKLVRDADLYALLSETTCREIFGAHVYVDVPNFAQLATEIDGEDYPRLIQAIHLYQREVSRIVEGSGVFDGIRVHFQGPKLHALFYRPIDARGELATKAVLLQAVLSEFARSVFNPAYPRLTDIVISSGADIGDAIGTQDGMKGDRELLFIGDPANYAARIIAGPGQLRLTGRLYDELGKEIRQLCSKADDGNYVLGSFGWSILERLLNNAGIKWTPDASAARLKEDKLKFPLKDITYSDADIAIDLDNLGITNNKRVRAASVFADVDGFTRYIAAATTDEQKQSALRVLHAIRKEMAAVIKHDFDGLRIQYQGDRVQALFHLPKDDPGAVVAKAVSAAVGLQSSMQYSLKDCLPELGTLQLAIGIDFGLTLVSKLGTRGQRDRICVGMAVQRAAACQESCKGGEIGITSPVYILLDEATQGQFRFDEKRALYVATGLTAEKTERLKRVAAYAGGQPVFLRSAKTGVSIGSTEASGARQVLPSKSYAY
jgi:class 3 adenylate cyclase